MALEHERMKESGVFSFLNPYSYRLLRNEAVAPKIDGYYFDGISLVWLWNALHRQKMKRVSFDMTSLAPIVFEQAVAHDNTVYLIGSTQEAIVEAVAVLGERFPGLRLIGSRNGYFADESEWAEAVRTISELNPDIIVVGMGAPRQERFLVDVRNRGWSGVGFTCGGFLHQTAARGIEYYPSFVDRWNLRWLFRIINEPRLALRYLCDYPIGMLLFLLDILVGRAQLKQCKNASRPMMMWRRG